MKILWITKLPEQVQREALGGQNYGAQHPATWIIAHLPPPPGIELHIACLWPGGTSPKTVAYQGAMFHLIPCPRHGRSLSLFLFDTHLYRSLYRRLKPDVVHGWGTEDSNGLVAVRLSPDRHVVGIQGLMNVINVRSRPPLRNRLSAVVEHVTLKRARHVVAESVFAAEASSRLCHHTKPVVIAQPVQAAVLQAEPGDKSEKLAVFLGRITRQKGINDAVEAFARTAPDSWKLKIMGGGYDHEKKELGAMLDKFRLVDRTSYTGNLPGHEVTRVLRDAAMLILPTKVDSGPTALKEALCMGVWPVCYDNTGPGEMIRAFQYGMLARDKDKDHLARCLEESFTCTPWKDSERRLSCVNKARCAFSREKAWQQLSGLYYEIMAESPGKGCL